MDDDKVKELFKGFNPELGMTDTTFMSRLKKGMEAVELVKQHQRKLHSLYKRALLAASIAAFAMGSLLSSLYPTLMKMLSAITLTLPSQLQHTTLSLGQPVICWGMIGSVCLLTALSVYDLTRTRLLSLATRE